MRCCEARGTRCIEARFNRSGAPASARACAPVKRLEVGGWLGLEGDACALSPIPGLTLTPTLAPDLCFLALAPTPAQTLDLDHLEPTPATRSALTLTPTHTLALTYSHPHLHPYR